MKQWVLVCLMVVVPLTALADQRLDRARELIEAEKYKEASEVLKPITKKEINNIDAWLLLGAAYEGQGLERRALPAYKEVLRVDRYNLEGALGAGRNMVAIRKRTQAVALYKKVMKKHPGEARLHFALGMAYNEMSEVNYAFEQYKILKDKDEELAQILYDAIFMR